MLADQSIMDEISKVMLEHPFMYYHEITDYKLECGLSLYAYWVLEPVELRYRVSSIYLYNEATPEISLFTATLNEIQIITNELNRSL